MSLKTTIEADIKKAMLAREKDKLRALRAIKASILLAETEKGATGDDLTPEKEMAILTKAVKQRKESAEIFIQQNREDLSAPELEEAEIIASYLPAQMSEEEVKEKVATIITQVGASSPKDMGKVMGVASKELAGKADGKLIATLVKQLLA
ncbi:MAG: GatB/YqeY domain-containing protein [Cyclobacteriaceae bacterium]